MPTVADGDQHRIDIFAGEEFAEVAIGLALLIPIMGVHELFGVAQTAFATI
jgi:hypothetical protein